IRRIAEKSKSGQTIQWRNEPQHREDEAKQSAGQSEAAIYRREYDVECGRENDHADAISNEADERGAKLRLVRENVARGVGGVARDDERPEQNEVTKNHDRKGEQTGNTCDFCGGPL